MRRSPDDSRKELAGVLDSGSVLTNLSSGMSSTGSKRWDRVDMRAGLAGGVRTGKCSSALRRTDKSVALRPIDGLGRVSDNGEGKEPFRFTFLGEMWGRS